MEQSKSVRHRVAVDSLGRMPSAGTLSRTLVPILRPDRLEGVCLLSATGTPLPPRLPAGQVTPTRTVRYHPDMADQEPTTTNPRDNWVDHTGRHHYHGPICGEYRPVAGNVTCPACPSACPNCGAWSVRRA